MPSAGGTLSHNKGTRAGSKVEAGLVGTLWTLYGRHGGA